MQIVRNISLRKGSCALGVLMTRLPKSNGCSSGRGVMLSNLLRVVRRLEQLEKATERGGSDKAKARTGKDAA